MFRSSHSRRSRRAGSVLAVAFLALSVAGSASADPAAIAPVANAAPEVVSKRVDDRLAKLTAALDRYDESLEYYDRLVQYRPDAEGVMLGRGELLLRMERLDEAIEQFEKAIYFQRIWE